MRLSTRVLEHVVAVGEEPHFGRAAERLANGKLTRSLPRLTS
jgi:hypothetical protein